MGKKLSFADIRVVKKNAVGDAKEEDTEQAIVKVAFKRFSTAWNDNESDRPFPIKASDLPYGAFVSVRLQSPSSSGTDDTTNKHDLPAEVISWQLLQDPKQAAEEVASSGQNHGGILYSTYLRERGNRFSKTTKGQRMALELQDKQQQPYDNLSEDDPLANSKKRARVSLSTNKDATTSKVLETSNDDLQEGGHGDKLAKAMRARIFAQWLLDMYGASILQQGSGVLDVAGGKGNLAIELAIAGQIKCTVIDPMIRKRQQSFPPKRETKRIRKAGGPLPEHLPTFFNQTSFLDTYGLSNIGTTSDDKGSEGKANVKHDTAYGDHVNNEATNNEHRLVSSCSLLVGLHPDQTTEDIVQVALRYNKPFAVVPCCVFPSFFPTRLLPDGKPVVTHAQFCEYLLKLDPSLQTAELPFQGRNIVIYRKSTTSKTNAAARSSSVEAKE